MHIVVTGANSGIGYTAARELAREGHDVVLACRDARRGEDALLRLRKEVPTAQARVGELDLASLASVRGFAQGVERVDVLVNNAGVMAPPKRSETADGFELQFGTNHLGHFALSALLFDRVKAGEGGGRVVTVSSIAHKTGKMRWDDLQWEHGYKAWGAYGQSKLANLVFSLELSRRAAAANLDLRSIGVHPGYSATNLQSTGGFVQDLLMKVGNLVMAQSDEAGAKPTVRAVTGDDPSGTYLGPTGIQEMRGKVGIAHPVSLAADEETGRRLWEVSEELTGVEFVV